MNEYDIKRLGLILAVQADIDGMKASNLSAKLRRESDIPYIAIHFSREADKIRCIVNKPNEQL